MQVESPSRRNFLLIWRDPVKTPVSYTAPIANTHPAAFRPLPPMETIASKSVIKEHAVAQINSAYCTAWRGLPCRVCFELCPVDGALQLQRGERTMVPTAGNSPCTGCQTCIQHCPSNGALQLVEAQGQVQVVSRLERHV